MENMMLDENGNHKCRIFGPLQSGDMISLDDECKFNDIPSKVDNYIGREQNMHEVIVNVSS